GAGRPHRIASWIDAAAVNAGDGRHEHPTQALLDLLTLRRRLGSDSFRGLRVGIVGDVRHSRVARSGVKAFAAVGADVTVVGPPTLLPESLEGWPARAATDLDDVLPELDVVYLLRIQRERLGSALLPSLREYTSRYGLTAARAARLKPDTVVMHPGPMNRGVEIAAELAAAGCLVVPGFVDLHAHLREPGDEEAETIETGARAAALGGFTAVVAMPNTQPPLDDAAVVASVLAAGREATCDVVSAGCI